MKTFSASPPGDTIRDIMEEQNISRRSLCGKLDISGEAFTNLLDGTYRIDNDMACKLSEHLGSTPEFWENRERQYRDALGGEHDCNRGDCNMEMKGKYVIDDDMLAAWRTGCIQWRDKNPDRSCRGCLYDGVGVRKDCCEFNDDAMQKIFQSHPLKDELLKIENLNMSVVIAYEAGMREGVRKGREDVLDNLIERYEKIIEYGSGVTFNHSITYEWMYGGIVSYLESLRKGGKE